jgi:hypothetical protein
MRFWLKKYLPSDTPVKAISYQLTSAKHRLASADIYWMTLEGQVC